MTSTEHTPLPWDAVEANEHHGPYITTAFGTTVCDLYAMSDPMSGERKPITFTDGNINLHLIVKCVNAHDELVATVDKLERALKRANNKNIKLIAENKKRMVALLDERAPLKFEQARAALAKAGAL